jgi:hypothetical protein
MVKKIFLSCIILACICAVAHTKTRVPAYVRAQTQIHMLNYYYGLMEYYLGYCDKIDEQELEETDIVLFEGKYILNAKDELERQQGLKEVNVQLQKILQDMQKNTHEYRVFLRAQLGDYGNAQGGFKCDIVNNYSCLDLSPLNDAGNEGSARSIMERGMLFGKVSKIKIFFVNTEEFKILKYPADKKDTFLKSRTDAGGKVNMDVYAVVNIEILPKDEYKRMYDNIEKNIYMPGVENNYYMLARIKSIELFADMGLRNKIGNVGVFSQTLKMQ